MTRLVKVGDIVSDTPCPLCSGTEWIVDSSGIAETPIRYWLLCARSSSTVWTCVESKDIPEDMEAVDGS